MDANRNSRPVPVIENELSFSRKKKSTSASSTEHHETPRSPAKTAPPISRIFRHRPTSTPGACAVSFRKSQQVQQETNIQSPFYTNLDKLYFDQCFTRLSFLGSGSFGLVVKVQSKEDGKLYAVKKSRERFRSDADRKHHLEEVNKNELIKEHCNCVRFYKAWEECDHVYIQSELCEMSLKDYAENVQSIEETEIWNVIVDLSIGLKHLHDSNFAHMDIKPANLFLGRDGLYKIGDFGLVVELTRDLNDAMDGDSKYLAPELMEGKFSKAADIFSLGITILELACSLELPRGGDLWHQLRNNELPFEFTQGLSDDLIILVSNMMDRNPDNRPTINEIINKPCFVQAKKLREIFHTKELSSSKFSTFLFYILGIFFNLFSFFLNGFNTFWYEKRQTSHVKRELVPCITINEPIEIRQGTPEGVGCISCYTPTQFSSSSSPALSPVFKDSPTFQSTAARLKEDLLRISPIDHHTPKNSNISQRFDDYSPCASSGASSERAVRSKLFSYSDDEEEEVSVHSLSLNLMKVFDEDSG